MLTGIDGDDLPYEENRSIADLIPDAAAMLGLDVPARDDVVGLKPGEAVRVQFSGHLLQVGRHPWLGGTSVVCPSSTSSELLAGAQRDRTCPLCDRKRAGRLEPYLPVRLISRQWKGEWRSERSKPAKFLKLTTKAVELLASEHSKAGNGDRVWEIGRGKDVYGLYWAAASPVPWQDLQAVAPASFTQLAVWSAKALDDFAAMIDVVERDGVILERGRVAS